MKWFSLFGAIIVGVAVVATPVSARDDELILLPDESLPIDGTMAIINRRRCINPNGEEVTAKCPIIPVDESTPCPTGPCFSGRNGCEYIFGNNRALQRIQENLGQVTNRVDVGTGGVGKQVDPDENNKIVCYKERQCKCQPDEYSVDNVCKVGEFKYIGIMKYIITNRTCPVTIDTIDPP